MQQASVRPPLRVLADSEGWLLDKWLVAVGAHVYRQQRVAVLKSVSTGAVDHALAPRAGTLHSLCVRQGEEVERSHKPIAEIQFCPHSVVFRGVCAVCGEEAEAPHFADTAVGEPRLPVAYNATSLSVTRAEAESVATATARRLFETRRLSLVLDLDHTLVHATDDPRAAAIVHHSPQGVDVASVASFTLDSRADLGPETTMHLKLRPNLPEFLARVAEKFELHIYTMGSRPYADRVAQLIDPDSRFFSRRITSREDFSEGNCNQKSIQRLFPCDDSMVLIVDDREDVWINSTGQTFMPNLIRASPYSFWDGLHEAYDRASSVKDSKPPSPLAASKEAYSPAPAAISDNDNPTKQPNTPRYDGVPNPENGIRPLGSILTVKKERHENGRPQELDVEENVQLPVTKKIESVRVEGPTDTSHKQEAGRKAPAQVANENTKPINLAVGPTPTFSEELRRVVKGWWDRDASPKSSNHLLRLAAVLEDCHSSFFRQSTMVKHRSTPPRLQKFESPADVKEILSSLRSKVLAGCVITFTGIIPTGSRPETSSAWCLALRFGAICSMEFVNGRTTHVVASQHRSATTQKCKEAMHFGTAYIVTLNWVEDSALNFERQEELSYCDKAKPRFPSHVEFRKFVEDRHKEAALLLRKRSKDELNDIVHGESRLPQKRQKTSVPLAEDAGTYDAVHAGTSADVQVLSGDEIDAAIDSAFD